MYIYIYKNIFRNYKVSTCFNYPELGYPVGTIRQCHGGVSLTNWVIYNDLTATKAWNDC